MMRRLGDFQKYRSSRSSPSSSSVELESSMRFDGSIEPLSSIDRTQIEPNPYINESFFYKYTVKEKNSPKFPHFLKLFSWENSENCF